MNNFICTKESQWQPGGVDGFSSKDLLNKNNGAVKLIKVGSKATYPIHLHPDKTEYIYVLEGNATITIGDKSKIGERGDFFVLPAAIHHNIVNHSEEECLLLVGSIKT